jgi:aspartate/methionine/tyrosine aminotransferase
MIARADLAERAAQLNEFIISCASGVTQKAAETALRDGEPEVHRLLRQLKSNRDFCLDALTAMPGVTVPRPEGAFYLFPRIAGLTDSFDFCRRLLLETHVGITPGSAFGEGGEGSVRICYAANQADVLKPAMERISGFLRC